MDNGETWLIYPYLLTQQNKKKFIIDNTYQGMELDSTYNYTFIISELISTEYYETTINEKGNAVRKSGPYIIYKVIPRTEKIDSGISLTDINGPVQVVTGGSEGYQHIENSSFSKNIEEYKDLMIQNGIPEEDINIVIENPNDEHIKKSFLSKYGLELAKISVNTAGVVVNLLKVLQN